jgi:GLPGLI family protein
MKKIVILITVLPLFIVQIKAQEILDTAYMECTYKYTYVNDTLNAKYSISLYPTNVEDPEMILLIGDDYSKFYSYNNYIYDSTINSKSESELSDVLQNLGNLTQNYKRGESFKIYKNYSDSTIIFTDRLMGPYKFFYKEQMYLQKWKIEDETKEISDYKCQKATCTFRGRDYVAWFTREIPINEGPWKFSGLPGLIVQVYDMQEHYKFVLCSIRKTNKAITFNENDYKETTLENYINYSRSFIKNPLSLFGKGIVKDSDGRVVQMKPRRYDVMERDIK